MVHPASREERTQTSENVPHNREDEAEEFADTLNFLIILLHFYAFMSRGQLGSGSPTGVKLA